MRASRASGVGVLLAAVALAAAVPEPAVAVIPSWTQEAVQRLKTLGVLPLWLGNVRPVPLTDVRAAAQEVAGREMTALAPADRDLLERVSRWAGVGLEGAPGLFFATAYTLARTFGLDRRAALVDGVGTGREWTVGWAVDSPTAGLRLGEEGAFFLGRERLGWGPGGEGGLLFSDAAGPFDRIQYFTTWRGVRYTKVVGWLDGGRSLVAARADWMVRPNLRLGVSESILMEGGPYWPLVLQPVPILINQVLAFVLLGQQAGIDSNYLGSADLEWLPRPGLRLFGEVLIDSLELPPNPFPWRWGATAGFQSARPAGGSYLLQYTLVANWTYSTGRPTLHYLLRGMPLAHPLGADFDALHLRWTPSADGRLSLWGTYIRKGEGEVGRLWTDLTDATTNAFLSGVVEYSLVLGLDLQVGPQQGAGLTASVRPWVARRENAGHVPGAVRTDWGLEISAEWTGP